MARELGRGHGSGKLILCGEHAVVYGHPAIALAVDRGTRVTLSRREGPTTIEAAFSDPRLRPALCAVLPEHGLTVHIETDLPIGRGMGSSAALAVATVRALADWRGEHPTAHAVFASAFDIERVFHGTPSGLDHAVSDRGGVVSYRKGPAGPELTPLPTPSWRLVVLDSGVAGDTRALVAGVSARRPAVDRALARIGALVDAARAALHDPDALGPLLDENHALLQQIGVSTPALDRLVDLARRAGARGAKLAGAGGGGVVLALVDDPAPVLAAAARAGVPAFTAGVAPTREDR